MLDASHLTRRFGSRTAVDDVSLRLRPGEIVALLGPNGAGKTTTLRMLAGLIAPTAGEVRVEGTLIEPATAGRLRSRIGFLTEAPGLWDRLTVHENLLVHAQLQGVADPESAVVTALDTFGVADRARETPAQLSKGLRQRVALARTLLHDPRIVLLDEPTSGLDPESARDVRGLILRMRDEGRVVLISTHHLDEVDRVADRVAVLRTRLIAVDTPGALRARLFGARVRIGVSADPGRFAEVLRAAGLADVRVEGHTLSVPRSVSQSASQNASRNATQSASHGADQGGEDDTTTPALVRRLVEAGAGIESVEREEPSLETVYLQLLQQDDDGHGGRGQGDTGQVLP
jgi:ABC-2 type transport system ATP-binding protein